jgi:hypothetical protein
VLKTSIKTDECGTREVKGNGRFPKEGAEWCQLLPLKKERKRLKK